MVESFENLDNILRDWVKDKVQKTIVEALNRYEKLKEERKKKYSSSLSRQSSETKPNTKLVKLCLEFNKPNKQNDYDSLKIIVDTDWCQEWNIETSLLKIS